MGLSKIKKTIANWFLLWYNKHILGGDMFKYLEENLQLIQNSDEVCFIRPYKLEKGGRALLP